MRAILVLAVLAATLTASAGGAGIVPCADERGCPDLSVDTVRMKPRASWDTWTEAECAVQEGLIQPGARHVIRFALATPNLGAGDLVIGHPSEHPEWFEWGACHQHWHFRGFAEFRLWRPEQHAQFVAYRAASPLATADEVLDAHPELRDGLVIGRKVGFCLMDVVQYVPTAPQRYTDCFVEQGISAGWGDMYLANIVGQWVDVTGVPPGVYILEAEVNPERRFTESVYANNAAALPITLDLAV